MARIKPLDRDKVAPEAAGVFDARERDGEPTMNAIRTMARVPEIVGPILDLFDRLARDKSSKSSIPKRIRHLVMLRVVRINECRY